MGTSDKCDDICVVYVLLSMRDAMMARLGEGVLVLGHAVHSGRLSRGLQLTMARDHVSTTEMTDSDNQRTFDEPTNPSPSTHTPTLVHAPLDDAFSQAGYGTRTSLFTVLTHPLLRVFRHSSLLYSSPLTPWLNSQPNVATTCSMNAVATPSNSSPLSESSSGRVNTRAVSALHCVVTPPARRAVAD